MLTDCRQRTVSGVTGVQEPGRAESTTRAAVRVERLVQRRSPQNGTVLEERQRGSAHTTTNRRAQPRWG
jgi:hypothetical protein